MLWFSWQNTNGVNFYNILTQDPDEKLASSAGKDFIGKTAGAKCSKSNKNSWLDGVAETECMS